MITDIPDGNGERHWFEWTAATGETVALRAEPTTPADEVGYTDALTIDVMRCGALVRTVRITHDEARQYPQLAAYLDLQSARLSVRALRESGEHNPGASRALWGAVKSAEQRLQAALVGRALADEDWHPAPAPEVRS